MNQLLRILSAGLLTAVLLSSCSAAISDVTDRPAQDRVTTAVSTLPLPPSDPLAPETDSLAEPVIYPSWQGRDDIELLTKIDDRNGDLQSVTGWGDQLLLSFARYDPDSGSYRDASAGLLNLTTGKLSEAVPLPGGSWRAVFLDSGRVCLYDPLSCAVKVYDLAGNLRFSYESDTPSVGLSIDPTGNGTLWCYSGSSPTLTCVALDGSFTRRFTVPDAEGGYVAGHREGIAYYFAQSGQSNRLYTVSSDGSLSLLSDTEGYYWGGGCLYADGSPGRILPLDDPDTVYLACGEDAFSWIAAEVGGHLLAERFADEENCTYLWVLDYENAVRYPELRAEGECDYRHFYAPEAGVLYFTVSSYDAGAEVQNTEILRWNYQHDGADADLICTTRAEEDLQNAEIAARIKEKWGVSVIYAEPQIHKVASDYSTIAITDSAKLHDALLQLEQALAAYPDDFFDDLCYGDYTVLELYLCGKFTPLTAAGITTAEALSNTRGSAMVIGFDVNQMDGEYVRVLAHELLHIMERRIDQIDPDALAEWITLTPGGHDAYYYSYHDENGNEMNDQSNTYYFESDPANAYFVDAYSKSFPTEDRARVFEKLMESGGDPYFADSPVLITKARTLCRIIREYFPSVAALQCASWEVE